MKILQAIYQFKSGGGALQVVVDLAKAARSDGHTVTVLSKDTPISTAVGAERFFTGNKLQDWWRLWQHCQQEQYDIIHVHDRYCSLLVSLLPQAPASVQTNHIAYSTQRRLTRFANKVVGCSQSMDRHHAEFFQLPASRRALIPNGVSFARPDATKVAALRQNLPLVIGNRHICLTVARLSQQKGHSYLLEAIAQLPASLRQNWCFVLAGDGDLEQQLRDLAVQLGIASDVVFLGHTTDVPQWLAIAEAFVLPSLYEGLPLALLEAIAAGLPCIATAVDGNLEVLRHTENGLLCPKADAQSLSQALITLLDDAALRTNLGKQAQADYWNYWTFDRTWQKYAELYLQLSQPQHRYA
ncbi:glycosyltransferase [Aliterella atlantica]|uniref:glycosyltransferase n=1 Tax=Aliterella atlantica TaxID=1827278 RepID=UPI0006971634|nr:glycosyltransferase [Aliterella atlantica]